MRLRASVNTCLKGHFVHPSRFGLGPNEDKRTTSTCTTNRQIVASSFLVRKLDFLHGENLRSRWRERAMRYYCDYEHGCSRCGGHFASDEINTYTTVWTIVLVLQVVPSSSILYRLGTPIYLQAASKLKTGTEHHQGFEGAGGVAGEGGVPTVTTTEAWSRPPLASTAITLTV
jgi:hypothetical protein